jgi:hypothetical protein
LSGVSKPTNQIDGSVLIFLVALAFRPEFADPSLRSGQALKVRAPFELGHYKTGAMCRPWTPSGSNRKCAARQTWLAGLAMDERSRPPPRESSRPSFSRVVTRKVIIEKIAFLSY